MHPQLHPALSDIARQRQLHATWHIYLIEPGEQKKPTEWYTHMLLGLSRQGQRDLDRALAPHTSGEWLRTPKNLEKAIVNADLKKRLANANLKVLDNRVRQGKSLTARFARAATAVRGGRTRPPTVQPLTPKQGEWRAHHEYSFLNDDSEFLPGNPWRSAFRTLRNANKNRTAAIHPLARIDARTSITPPSPPPVSPVSPHTAEPRPRTPSPPLGGWPRRPRSAPAAPAARAMQQQRRLYRAPDPHAMLRPVAEALHTAVDKLLLIDAVHAPPMVLAFLYDIIFTMMSHRQPRQPNRGVPLLMIGAPPAGGRNSNAPQNFGAPLIHGAYGQFFELLAFMANHVRTAKNRFDVILAIIHDRIRRPADMPGLIDDSLAYINLVGGVAVLLATLMLARKMLRIRRDDDH